MGGHDGQVLSLAFLPKEKHIASVGRDGTFRIWDTDSGKELRCANVGSTRIVEACLSANGDRLAAWDIKEKEKLCLWDVVADFKRKRLEKIPEGIGAFALSPDGRTLLASDWRVDVSGHLFLWDLTREQSTKPLVRKILTEEEAKNSSIDDIVFSADAKWAAVGVGEGDVRLVNLAAFKSAAPRAKEDERARRLGEFWRSSLALSADGSAVAVGTWYFSFGLFTNPDQPTLYVCDTARPGRDQPFGLHKKRRESVDAVAFSPDGKTLAAAWNDGTILLWDMATAKVRRSLQGHQGPVSRLVFSRDGSVLASGGADTTILIWDLRRR